MMVELVKIVYTYVYDTWSICNGLWKGEHSRVGFSGARMGDVSV